MFKNILCAKRKSNYGKIHEMFDNLISRWPNLQSQGAGVLVEFKVRE